MTVLYIDPGETTGWAMWASNTFGSGQKDFLETGNFLDAITLQGGSLLKIGWEAFLIGAHTARKPGSHWAIESIGVARYYALKRGCVILPSYPSSSLPPDTIRDRQLKRIGWHKPGRPHANDASHHLMRYMLSSKVMPEEMVKKVVGDGT
jgi:hypothetical protein